MPRAARPTASPAHSQQSSVYSDTASEDSAASPSYLISDASVDSNTSAQRIAEEDSLLDASDTEVAARAQFLLAEQQESASNASSTMTAFDLPRKVPPTPEGKALAHSQAMDFLRAKVAQAGEDDWRFASHHGTTSFAEPAVLLGVGKQYEQGESESWAEKAFNLESYGGEQREFEDPADGAEMELDGGRVGDGVGVGYD